MARFDLQFPDLNEMEQAIKNYAGDAEAAINDVLHNEANILISDEIYRLMPESGKHWKGKQKAAKRTKSLTSETENLSVTVKSKKTHNYLYFPDDGTNTRRHVGNQQFFKRGAENKIETIKDRCVMRLVEDF